MYNGPTKIKIGAYDWRVVLEEGEGDTCGQADFGAHALRLWPENLTSNNHLAGTLLHECLHVIFDNGNLRQLKKDKEKREEQIVSAFEAGLVSLLRDNPKLFIWMKKCLK